MLSRKHTNLLWPGGELSEETSEINTTSESVSQIEVLKSEEYEELN